MAERVGLEEGQHPLQRLIYEKGFTMTDFADKCGISRATLYALFSGKNKSMRTEHQYKMSEILHEPFERIVHMSTEGL